MAFTNSALMSTPTTVCPLCAITAAMGEPSLPNPIIDSFMRFLFLPDDWHPPARPKGPRGHFQNRRRLLSLEFRDAHQAQNAPHSLFVVAFGDNLFGAAALLHVQFEDLVEQIVRRQAVLVGLA